MDASVKWSTAGLCFGPYDVYINYLDVNLDSYLLKFADDANIFSEVSFLGKVANLQSDLNKLYKCSEDPQMLFSTQKCKCLHIV